MNQQNFRQSTQVPWRALYPVSSTMQPLDSAPLFGVILRTKNRSLLLHRALSSICSQSYIAWHVYLVNDGGDSSQVELVVENYRKALCDRITIIHHDESQGMEAASNSALGKMLSENLVAVHDDDDAWHPDFLQNVAEFFLRCENGRFLAVVTGCTVVVERIERGEVIEVSRHLWPYGRGIADAQELLVGNKFPPICLVIRRAELAMIGGFNPALKVLGDWEVNLRLMTLGDFGFIDRPLAYYHHRVGGTNSAYSNTIIDGVQTHAAQEVLLRNAIVRSALIANPELLGFLMPVMRSCSRIEERLWKLDAIERDLNALLKQQRLSQPPKPFNWLAALLELELGKLLSTLGQKQAGDVGWNHAKALLTGRDPGEALSLYQWVSARFKLEMAKLLCTLGQKEIGVAMWDDARGRLGWTK
jgi:glycosyltransferase involved in cell wall biosynthesis